MIAVVGLTAALVIVGNEDDTGVTSGTPTGQINYGGFNPATGRPDSAPLPQRDAQAPSASAAPDYVNPSTGYPSLRYDGGPEEGTTGPSR
jgi:hypothetical protein